MRYATCGSILRIIGITIIMSSYANTWNEPDQFDLYVKKFRSLFTMHNVGFGSPEDFPHFMVKLAQDRHFAMDFWALTGTLSKREGGELGVDETLAVIADAVIGGPIPAGDDGVRVLIDELAALLAGVDLYSPSRLNDEDGEEEDVETVFPPLASPPQSSSPPLSPPPPVSSPVHAGSHTRFADMADRAASEVPLASSAPAPVVVSSAVASEQGRSFTATAAPTATASHQFDETLMRLELNSIELKEHLEDLDKKMSMIVPHLEALTSEVKPIQRRRSVAEEPLDNVFQKSVRKPEEMPRLVLEPREEPLVDKHEGPPIPTPFAGYASPKSHGRNGALAAAVILFALIVGGGLVLQQRYGSSIWQRAGVTLRERYDALLEKMDGEDTGQTATNPASDNATASTVPESSPAAAASDGDRSVTPQTASAPIPSISTPVPERAPEQTMAEPAGAPQAVDTRSTQRISQKKTHPASAEAVRTASTNDEAGAVNVAPAVMEANLLASRVPAYPETAKENRIEGPVVMQAIISKDGFVDRVHVLEGNPRLRSAAAEAVQKWRFKPYLINGKPVEVATTITVNFELDDW
jgi:TonB family protein